MPRSAALARQALLPSGPAPKPQRLVRILTDGSRSNSGFAALLDPWFRTASSLIQDGAPACTELDSIVVAVDLQSIETIAALKAIDRELRRFKNRVFIINANVRLISARAYAMGATSVVRAPVTAQKLITALTHHDDALAASREAAEQGAAALAHMFSAVHAGRSPDALAAQAAATVIADTIENDRLCNWVDAVRSHHEGTYQHCLLVTGIAVDFGVSIGVPRRDLERLCFAAMFHDVGKAMIPAAILDKPSKLDDAERKIIEAHPGAGYDILKPLPGISTEVLDAVRHHHEFLDGSGYPDRLSGGEISDLVRVLTISDLFAALIEARSYRPPIPRNEAYEIICGMKGKLEWPLVAAFRNTALVR